MCGILFTNNPNINRELFIEALNMMNHRGPDADGYKEQGSIKLGHKRLKVVDLEDRSNQPFNSPCGRYSIIFNGEIYNFRELRSEFKLNCLTSSDTEVILKLYIKLGLRFLEYLEGMFAFIIYDKKQNEFFVARDRLGVKPLYFLKEKNYITLSSEIAPLLRFSNNLEIDDIALRQYKKLRTFFNERTIYKSIKVFPAANYFFDNKFQSYWKLSESDQAPPCDEEISELIKNSISMRLNADVSYGSFLSGGIDSTIITKLSKPKHTWTVGFENKNEFHWSMIPAKEIGSKHHQILIQNDEFKELAKFMIKKRREPLSVPNEVLIYKMACNVKKENTIILSGEGADELFFGYDRIFTWAQNTASWDIEEFSKLYSYGSNLDIEIVEDAISPFIHLESPIKIVSHFFQLAHLKGLLRRLDNSTMLSSVEARVPFVDSHKLIERLSGVPFNYRMLNGVVKAPLKRVFADQINPEIIQRKKVGFPVPLKDIFKDSHNNKNPMDNWFDFNLKCLQII